MSHFLIGVIIPFGNKLTNKTIREAIDTQLEPFDENKEASPYETECDCIYLKEHQTFPPVNPNEVCEECNNSGKRMSTYNPQSKWDWYEVGGRWDGAIQNKPHEVNESQELFSKYWGKNGWHGMQHLAEQEQLRDDYLKRNVVPVQFVLDILVPIWDNQKRQGDNKDFWGEEGWGALFALVTPEAEWIAEADAGWWGMTKNRKELGEWRGSVMKVLDKYKRNQLVAVDCHI